MAEGVPFPAFLQLESGNNEAAKTRFSADVDAVINSVNRKLTDFSAEAQRHLTAALSVPRNQAGALDLQIPELREAAAAQQARALAAREVANATLAAAKAEGTYTQEVRESIVAAKQLAAAEEQEARAALARIGIAERVQAELNKTASATDTVVAATRRNGLAQQELAKSSRVTNMAFAQLGQQLTDVTVQVEMGTRATTIFVQQVPQMAWALSSLEGSANKTHARIGRFASFLSGPWGAAVFMATGVLGPFVARLLEAEDATRQAEFASHAFGDAQSILGQVVDLTTGKIRDQSEALLALARAQAVAGQIEARRQQAEARDAFGDITTYRAGIEASFGPGLRLVRQRPESADIIEAYQDGTLSLREAERGLKSLLETGLLTEEQYLDAAEAVTKFGVAAENLRVFEQLDKALGGDRAAMAAFLTPPKPRKPRTDNSADRLAEFGEDAAKKIANIRDRFLDIPPAVEASNRATRELDDVISDLGRRKPTGFRDLIQEAEHLKEILPELQFGRVIRELNDQAEQRLHIDGLILSGRDEEAAVLQTIWRIERELRPLTAEQRREVEGIVLAEEARIKANEKLFELQSAYLDATRSVRGELEAIFAGEGDLTNFKRIFAQLNSRVLVQNIFGDVLEELDNSVKSQFGRAVDQLETETERAGKAALDFASALIRATEAVATGNAGSLERQFDAVLGSGQVSAGGAANDNEIVVSAERLERGVAGLTPERYFELMSRRIVDPLVGELGDLLGPKLAGALGSVMSGALYGYSTGGTVGGVLGGVKGIVDDVLGLDGGKLSGLLGGALKGAQTGNFTAGLSNMFGLGLSGSGAQLGGAIGSFLPIPGGNIIGSVAGGLIGKIFGGNRTANAVLTGSGMTVGGKDRGNHGVASGLGGSVQEALQRVAEQLDAEIGSFFVTIGTRGGDFRVNTSGTSLKIKKGARNFGEDQAAALAYALADAIADGAIKGLSAAEQRLLKQNKDVDQAVAKVLDFRSVFDRLRAYQDPVGAALDELDKEFTRLRDIFREAGASAAEYAKLEELYGIERAQAVKEAMERVTGSLRGLLDEMTMGDMGLSLRDRKATAQDRYDELAARVRAGDVTAYDDFAQAARTLLDIERQISGSQSGYFDLFEEVRQLTKSTLDRVMATAEASANRDSPFGSGSNTPANDNQGVIDGLGQLGDRLIASLGGRLDAVNENLGALAARSGWSTNSPLALLREESSW